MTIKRVLSPQRIRRIPAQFSWLDQRLVRDRHIERCDAHALALYLFLVTVGDAHGLSYYSDASITGRLSMDPARLARARADLVRLGLVAHESPLYQVLALDAPAVPVLARELPREQSRERFAQLCAYLGKAR